MNRICPIRKKENKTGKITNLWDSSKRKKKKKTGKCNRGYHFAKKEQTVISEGEEMNKDRFWWSWGESSVGICEERESQRLENGGPDRRTSLKFFGTSLFVFPTKNSYLFVLIHHGRELLRHGCKILHFSLKFLRHGRKFLHIIDASFYVMTADFYTMTTNFCIIAANFCTLWPRTFTSWLQTLHYNCKL